MDESIVDGPPKVLVDEAKARDAATSPVSYPPPMIVVRYRRGWSGAMLPPALIVLIALALLRLRLNEKNWGSWWSPDGAPAVVDADIGVEAHPRGPTPLVEPPPLKASEDDSALAFFPMDGQDE